MDRKSAHHRAHLHTLQANNHVTGREETGECRGNPNVTRRPEAAHTVGMGLQAPALELRGNNSAHGATMLPTHV